MKALLATFLFATSICLSSVSSFAQEGLYSAPPPDDAAFIRFLNFSDGDSFSVGNFDVPQDRLISDDYSVVHAPEVDGLEIGGRYSVLPDGTFIHESFERPAEKVAIVLLNTGYAGDLSLRTADGSTEIITPTAALALNFRLVNPIKVPVQVFAGETALGDVVELSLRRGEDPSFIVDEAGDVTLIKSKVLPGLIE